jgi:hypothetical protein
MAIHDAFIFFNELDLLEIRLAELSKTVDRFVIVEAPVTFQGEPKPLYFAENRQRFAKYLPQIKHVVVLDMPETSTTWVREFHPRQATRHALSDAAATDLVHISDADEIPRASALRRAAKRDELVYLHNELFIYFLNWRWEDERWTRAYAAPWREVAKLDDLNAPRLKTPSDYLGLSEQEARARILWDAGWHFSYMGGAEKVVAKLAAFSHDEPEVARWKATDLLAEQIAAGRHFHTGAKLTPVRVDATFPRHVRERFADYVGRSLVDPVPGAPKATDALKAWLNHR